MLRQFYANIKNKDVFNLVLVESYVKGALIVVTRVGLPTLSGAKNDGPIFYHGKYLVNGDPNWVFESSHPKFCSGS